MRSLLVTLADWIRALRRPAEVTAEVSSLDELAWRPRPAGYRLDVTSAWLPRQRQPGCITIRVRMQGGEEVSVTMPLRTADRLARKILRAPVLQLAQLKDCQRPPRWLAGAFRLRSGRRLPDESRT